MGPPNFSGAFIVGGGTFTRQHMYMVLFPSQVMTIPEKDDTSNITSLTTNFKQLSLYQKGKGTFATFAEVLRYINS